MSKKKEEKIPDNEYKEPGPKDLKKFLEIQEEHDCEDLLKSLTTQVRGNMIPKFDRLQGTGVIVKKTEDGYVPVDVNDPAAVTAMKEFMDIHESFEKANISDFIIDRFKKSNVKFFCNDNINEHLVEGELELLELEVARNFETLLKSLLIDIENDHNTKETGKRVAKMFIQEIFSGRYLPEPEIKSFPNIAYDGAYYTGPISIRSTCAHHFMPIVGNCWVGIKPHNEVIGLSKFNRIVDHIASKPQIQEEMTVQIIDKISDLTETENVAVLIKAKHHCLTHRGVKEHDADMTTTILRGTFQWDSNIRNEFFATVNNMRGHE